MQSTTRTKQKRVGEKTTTKEQIRQNWHWRCEKLGQHTKVTPRPLTSISKGSLKTFYATSFSSVQDGFYALGKASMRSTLSILPTLSPTLPLKRFQCLSDWRRPSLVPQSAPDFDPDITVIAPVYHDAHKSPTFSVSKLWEWRQMACNGMRATLGPALQLRWAWLASIPGQPSVNAESGTLSSAPKCLPL